jgi:hypothetical protein
MTSSLPESDKVNLVNAPLSGKATEMLDVTGKFNSRSRLPQYLQSAMLVGAKPKPASRLGE